jgi:UDP-2-acetamido-3-amino-2,3-dideoxy-glucuronate N-acetyltransferase
MCLDHDIQWQKSPVIEPDVTIDSDTDVDPRATVGSGTSIWRGAAIREFAVIGSQCIIGRGAYIDDHVVMGDRVKVQNSALIYSPARIGDDVFIGPGAILTNDRNPRASTPDGRLKRAADWNAEPVTVGRGASIGAGAIIRAGVTIGEYALVGAGAVVVADVPDYGLVMGVPAKRTGWVGRHGVRLERADRFTWVCPVSGEPYDAQPGGIRRRGFPANAPVTNGARSDHGLSTVASDISRNGSDS